MNYKFLQLKINYNFEKNHKIFFNPKVHTHIGHSGLDLIVAFLIKILSPNTNKTT